MSEYRDRQNEFPDEIQNTLGAFLTSLQKAHHTNILTEVEFVKAVSDLKNIETKLEAGLLDAQQALTLMQSLPAIEYCDDEGFGLDKGRIKMNMRVNAHTSDKSTTEGGASSSGSASFGGGLLGALGGVHGSLKISGHFSHAAEHANESDYSAYTELEVWLKRTKPSPARRLTSQLMQEAIKNVGELAKSRQELQKEQMRQELGDKPVPKSIPKNENDGETKSDDSGDGGNTTDFGNGDSDPDDTDTADTGNDATY